MSVLGVPMKLSGFILDIEALPYQRSRAGSEAGEWMSSTSSLA
jgi:hypothetical protein